MATSKKNEKAAPVAPVADARSVIAANVGKIAAAQKQGDTAVGSLLLQGVLELSMLVKAGADVTVGADYMLALTNARKAAKSQPLLDDIKALPLAPRYGMTKLMRAAKEKPWFATFMGNVTSLHSATPIVETVLAEFGNKLFPKKGEVTEAPSVDVLKQWRVEFLAAKKRNANSKPKVVKPAERIATAIAALAEFKAWLPSLAHDHAQRCLEELGTIVDVIKANPQAKPEPEVDPTAALLAKLAGK